MYMRTVNTLVRLCELQYAAAFTISHIKKTFENIMAKEEIAPNEQLLLLSHNVFNFFLLLNFHSLMFTKCIPMCFPCLLQQIYIMWAKR